MDPSGKGGSVQNEAGESGGKGGEMNRGGEMDHCLQRRNVWINKTSPKYLLSRGEKRCSLDFQVSQIQMRELCPWYWQYLGDLFLRSRHHLIDISLTYDWNSPNVYVRYDLGTVLGSEGYNDLKKVLISNTRLTVSGALTHRLPQHTFKIQNGSRGLQRVITIVHWVLWITFAK